MLTNFRTILKVDGNKVDGVDKLKIETSSEEAFFFCEYEFKNGDKKEIKKFAVRSLFQENNSLVIDCISSGLNVF